MIFSFSKVRRMIVCVEQENGWKPVGIIFDAVIAPEEGKIMGFWVKTGNGNKILKPDEIREWDPKYKVCIQDESVLKDPESVVELQSVFKKEVPLIAAPVWDRGIYKGKVMDFVFDSYGFFIEHIWYKKGWLFWTKNRKINRSQIVKINKKGVFISEGGLIKSEKKKTSPESVPEV